ncbi:MAG: glycosyltransferase family 39 protein, partial [Dehalococcoidia bacterium]|nr:glycosyltransferase family 39 protein [Dehalococcoidia bacterium]
MSKSGWIAYWKRGWLYLLLVVVFIMHIVVITRPAEPMFDEKHYIPDARSILEGGGTTRTEHPPLAKLIIAASILVIGDNPYGWRLGSVVFGLSGIVFLYLICRRLGLPELATFFSVFLFAFENLSFVQASIAMLDVYSVTFMLAAFWVYLRNNYPVAAVLAGLSVLAKLTGITVLFVLVVHWLVSGRRYAWRFISSMFLTPVTVMVLLPVLDFVASGKFVDPIYSLHTMMDLSKSLTFESATHPSLSRPWDWVLRPLLMPYWYDPHYTAAISFTLWALIIPGMGYMVFQAIRYRCNTALFCLAWFLGAYLLWIPFSLLSDRISFVYYFYPTVGAVCIALG